MKIEKINENQVKIMLSRFDLDERDIKLGELAYGSEKAQELFRDIMEEAHMQCGFESENLPLMIEAIPYAQDSITIIVTKVQNPNDLEERFKQLQKKFQQDTHSESTNSEDLYSGDISHRDLYRSAKYRKEDSSEPDTPVFVFSFNTLDEASVAASRLYATVAGESQYSDMLFKHNGLFYLYIELPESVPGLALNINPVVSEFGHRHAASAYSKYYLMEHGSVMIKHGALEKLAILGE